MSKTMRVAAATVGLTAGLWGMALLPATAKVEPGEGSAGTSTAVRVVEREVIVPADDDGIGAEALAAGAATGVIIAGGIGFLAGRSRTSQRARA